MKKYQSYLLIFTLIFHSYLAYNQNIDADFIFENRVYKNSIYTVQIHREGEPLSYPIIELNGAKSLVLSFDDLSEDVSNYYYTLVHCDANWKASDLSIYEYMEGFDNQELTDYQFSFNTLITYVHYQVKIPNDDVKLLYSGNYIIKIYEDAEKENMVLCQRFFIVETHVGIQAKIRRPTDNLLTGQTVEVKLESSQLRVNDVNDIAVTVLQNMRYDNAINRLKLLYINGSELTYDFNNKNSFDAGNEFRRFNISNHKFQTAEVERIFFKAPYYHFLLKPDHARTYEPYLSEEDINGLCYIEKAGNQESNTEADYFFVHFQLLYNQPFIDADVYLFGALSNWNASKKYKMKYNFSAKAYELSVLLKQGYYNYQYALVKDGKKVINTGFFEGNHFETENDYTILIYHRAIGEFYDRLVGYKILRPQASKYRKAD